MLGHREFRDLLAGHGAVVAGVLSGTSADGIDVGLARFRRTLAGTWERPVLMGFAVAPFERELAHRLRAVLDGAPVGLGEIALLHRDLGRASGEAVARLAREHALRPDLVGSHGQTVWHHDGLVASGPATLQLGDGDFVAEACGAPVVSDFRQRDIAAGGEGAPLSALADPLLFAHLPRPAVILNLGGIANFTWLGQGGAAFAFDTGPANSLLDGLARRLLERPYDEDGRVAARGRVDPALVRELYEAEAYFQRAPPKSTGRDGFGEAYVERFLARAALHGCRATEDLLASAVALVATVIVEAWRAFLPEPACELVVAGGGARHRTLLDELARRLDLPVHASDRHGVDSKAREALVFAALAARFAAGEPSTSPAVTGARAGRLLGKLSPGEAARGG